jgi:hypothetical protein
MQKRITCRAAVSIPYGMFVKLTDDECNPDPTLDQGGIAVRPVFAVDDRGYRAGAQVIVQTDGAILADFGNGSLWVVLKNGRIVA